MLGDIGPQVAQSGRARIDANVQLGDPLATPGEAVEQVEFVDGGAETLGLDVGTVRRQVGPLLDHSEGAFRSLADRGVHVCGLGGGGHRAVPFGDMMP